MRDITYQQEDRRNIVAGGARQVSLIQHFVFDSSWYPDVD
jgi:hypothetical protein